MNNVKYICLALIILLVLVLIFQQSRKSYEMFNSLEFPTPENFKIVKINMDSVDISFKVPTTEQKVDYYNVIVSSYKGDNLDMPIGGFKALFKNLEELDCDNNNKCSVNIRIKDNGEDMDNELYYRIGLMAVYENGHSRIVDHSNLEVFKLGTDINRQIKLIEQARQIIEEKPVVSEPIERDEDSGEVCAMADGKFELIKQKLGGYPDNLFLEQQTGSNSLAELAQRQLSLGILDVNVHTKDLTA